MQQLSRFSKPQGYLPGQPEINPKGQMKAIILKSGKALKAHKMSMREHKREVKETNDTEKEVSIKTPSERVKIEKTQEVQA